MKPSEILFDKSIGKKEKFGHYLRERRNELGITLNVFAKKMKLSNAYISDIENGNRNAPMKYLKDVIKILKIDEDEINYFYDIAGCVHSNWPDINEYLAKTPNARKAIRLARDKNLTEKEFLEIISIIEQEKEQEL